MIVGRICVEMDSVRDILKQKGLSTGGAVQRQFTHLCMTHMQKYMPLRTGTTIKEMFNQNKLSYNQIVIDQPYAKYLYFGKVKVDPVTGAAGFLDGGGEWKSRRGVKKVETDRDLQYNKSGNHLAGPFWDRRMVADEGGKLTQELQEYVNNL